MAITGLNQKKMGQTMENTEKYLEIINSMGHQDQEDINSILNLVKAGLEDNSLDTNYINDMLEDFENFAEEPVAIKQFIKEFQKSELYKKIPVKPRSGPVPVKKTASKIRENKSEPFYILLFLLFLGLLIPALVYLYYYLLKNQEIYTERDLFWLFYCGILGVPVTLIFFYTLWVNYYLFRLKNSAMETSGTITELYETGIYDKNGIASHINITYSFSARTFKQTGFMVIPGISSGGSLKEGDEIRVRYLPEKPNWSRIILKDVPVKVYKGLIIFFSLLFLIFAGAEGYFFTHPHGVITAGRPINGQGSIRWPNGESYTGGFKDGKYDGQGIFIYVGGDKYEGGWKDGDEDGKGIFTRINGDKFTGVWKEGWGNVQGKLIFANGDIYTGHWENGKKTGKGTLSYKNGEKFSGLWKDDLMKKGTMVYKNGDKFTGEFFPGVQEEKEDYYYFDENNVYVEEAPVGLVSKGTLVYKNGDKYTGYLTGGKRNGNGTMVYKNGNLYEGEWLDNFKHGTGRMTYNDGKIEDGIWTKDRYDDPSQYLEKLLKVVKKKKKE
jgi:hypothetical protein